MTGMTEKIATGIPARVMVVDDITINLKIIAAMLAEMGCAVECHTGGEGALEAIRRSPPDLILLDISMPGMDGYAVAGAIKDHPPSSHIPIVFLSAYNSEEDKVKGFRAGGVDYITKPFFPEEVRARVAIHLRIHALQTRLEEQNQNLEKIVQTQIAQIADAQMTTIFALARLAESRDNDTGEHLERVMAYVRILATALRRSPAYHRSVTDGFVETIIQASVLHDIGKVAIPDSVLLKPGLLTPEEREIIARHTLVGAETLSAVLERHPDNFFIRVGIDIARSHHERWDGGGYPAGLAGEEIPLAARIMRIADVYDALTTARCYKRGWSHQEACREIVSAAGTEFDPALVAVFEQVAAEFATIHQPSVQTGVDGFLSGRELHGLAVRGGNA